jgi:hypothetical protein
VSTPEGLVSVGVSDSMLRPLVTPALLRHPVFNARQCWPHRVVAMAGDNLIRYNESPVPARLVSFDPSLPGEVSDLGFATSWFPSFDGSGVWRVLGRGRDVMSMRRSGIFEATP